MAEIQKPVLRLLLDNGGTIERQQAEPGTYLSFAKRIALGQLSSQQQSKLVEEIASVYQRLSENAMPQPKRAVTAPLAQDLPPVNGLRATKPVKTEPVEAAPLPAARPKAAAPKPVAPAPKPPAAPEPSYRTTSGRLSSAKKKALKAMIENVWKADSFGVFKLPVTKRIAPDYYDIVKEPMDLKTVRQNLDKGSYEDEHAFKHDMDLIFYNCELYNGTVSEVGKHGVQVKKVWLKAWQNSGLDTGDGGTSFPTPNFAAQGNKSAKRPQPVSEGQPAAKVARTGGVGRAPSLGAAQMSAQMSSHGTLPPAPKSAPSTAPGGMPSHAKPNAAAARGGAPAAPAIQALRDRGAFPEDRSQTLFEYIGGSDESQQAAVLEFLQHQCQVELPMDEDGEVELDPDALSSEVLWKLDDHMQQASGGRYKPGVGEPMLHLASAHDEETDDE